MVDGVFHITNLLRRPNSTRNTLERKVETRTIAKLEIVKYNFTCLWPFSWQCWRWQLRIGCWWLTLCHLLFLRNVGGELQDAFDTVHLSFSVGRGSNKPIQQASGADCSGERESCGSRRDTSLESSFDEPQPRATRAGVPEAIESS